MTRTRNKGNRAVDEALRAMNHAIASRPIPNHLKSVLEQLEPRSTSAKAASRG